MQPSASNFDIIMTGLTIFRHRALGMPTEQYNSEHLTQNYTRLSQLIALMNEGLVNLTSLSLVASKMITPSQ